MCHGFVTRPRVGLAGEDGHQTPQPEVREGRNFLHQRQGGVRLDAGFVGVTVCVDLDQHRQRGATCALAIEPVGDLAALDGVHPVEVFGDGSGFVALHPADEVPGEPGSVNFSNLRYRFIDVVLAKIAQAQRNSGCNVRRRFGFAHTDQGDVSRVATAGRAGCSDSLS